MARTKRKARGARARNQHIPFEPKHLELFRLASETWTPPAQILIRMGSKTWAFVADFLMENGHPVRLTVRIEAARRLILDEQMSVAYRLRGTAK